MKAITFEQPAMSGETALLERGLRATIHSYFGCSRRQDVVDHYLVDAVLSSHQPVNTEVWQEVMDNLPGLQTIMEARVVSGTFTLETPHAETRR